jgi:hypothetical protein
MLPARAGGLDFIKRIKAEEACKVPIIIGTTINRSCLEKAACSIINLFAAKNQLH